jgi:hypothetical protein
MPASQSKYGTWRDKKADQFRQKSTTGRDIGKIPAVVNRKRRTRGGKSFLVFCKTYHADRFSLPWSEDHERVGAKVEAAIRDGGTLAMAMPRGTGKTAMCITAVEFALMYGLHLGVALIGATEMHAQQMLESIQTDLETNDLLLADFPEICFPIRALEGIKQRRLLTNGEIIRMEFTANRIVLPSTAKDAAEAYVNVAGITGRVRGMQYARSDGRTVRPSLVILDDPQTDESARSDSQSRQREQVIRKAVLGLSGPGKKISAVMPCTIIEREDLADRLLDRKRNPQWQGERTQLVYAWPTATKLWEQYAAVRADGLRNDRGTREATEFYRENQAVMDEGSQVAWRERFNPDEISALQHAMNLRQDLGDAAFFAEYQNDPPKPISDELATLTADQIADKVNRIPRGLAPAGSTALTAFIDVQEELLYWLVCAWAPDASGVVLDYGAWPDQDRSYFLLRDAKPTLQQKYPGRGLEGTIYVGLEGLTDHILGREWKREDGVGMRIGRCLVDSGWGPSTEIIYRFCQQAIHSPILHPSKGMGISAAGLPVEMWNHKPGEQHGLNWVLRAARAGQPTRHLIYDTNWWKSWTHSRLSVAMGDRGGLTLFGDRPHDHHLLADHLTAEYRVRTTGRGRTVDAWQQKADRPDNHWLDCLVGCAVAASMLGVTLPGQESGRRERRKVIIPADRRVR